MRINADLTHHGYFFAGRLQVPCGPGWDSGGRLLCHSLNGFLCLDRCVILAGHSAGGALPCAGRGG